MRVRARVAGLAGALALVASLSGCITVHGETAIVPATTEREAQRALDRFVEVSNQANRAYDAPLSRTVERGPMGAIDQAALRAQKQADPGGNDDFEALELSDTTFHIPQQAGWPKFFLADSATSRNEETRWLLVFTRDSIDEQWFASYLAVVPEGQVPEFAEDEDGFLEDLPVGGDTASGLATAPGQLSADYAEYLKEGEGPFTDGPFTSGVLQMRELENDDPAREMRHQDEGSTERRFAPVAMRTADGGALVLFTTHEFDSQTVAPGFLPEVDPLVAALIDGTPQTSVTREWVAMQAALVPEGEGDTEVISRIPGVVGAQGE